MKTTILLPVISLFLFLASCTNPNDKKVNDQTSESSESGVTSTDWQSRYDKLEASDLPDNVIQLIGKEWMLVTAGDESSYNTMTASWGGMGYIWERPSTFIFIRDTRYTYQFLQQHESFTLSFFNEKYRNALRICGTMSGRNTDKVKEAGLTPLETPLGSMILVNYSFSLVKDQSVFGQFLEFIVFSVYLRPHFLKYHLYIIVPIIRIY